MDLIVDLPSVLQSSVLCEWVETSWEICRLDTAYCNKKLRPGFLQTLADSYMIPSAHTNEEDVNTWLFVRKIKAVDLTVCSNLIRDKDFIERFCGEIGSMATSISFEKEEEEESFSDPYESPYMIPSFVWPVLLKGCSKLRKLTVRWEKSILQ